MSDLIVERGAPYTLSLVLRNEDGSPQNLFGYEAAFVVTTEYDDTTPELSLDEASGIALGSGLGTVDVTITTSQTNALPNAPMFYRLDVGPPGALDRIEDGFLWLQRKP